MSDGFYLVNEKHGTATGSVIENLNVLYFRLNKAQYDGKATREHLKEYPDLYSSFKAEHPSYVLPFGNEADFVGVKAPEVGSPTFERVVTPAPETPPVIEPPAV